MIKILRMIKISNLEQKSTSFSEGTFRSELVLSIDYQKSLPSSFASTSKKTQVNMIQVIVENCEMSKFSFFRWSALIFDYWAVFWVLIEKKCIDHENFFAKRLSIEKTRLFLYNTNEVCTIR